MAPHEVQGLPLPVVSETTELLHAAKGETEETAGGQKPLPPVLKLYQEIALVVAEQKAAGQVVNNAQSPEAVQALDARIRALLSEYATTHADWHKYKYFNDVHYVRNLVEANEDFELIVLCWKKGQGSRVHTHSNSHCWLTVLQGTMTETVYDDIVSPSEDGQEQHKLVQKGVTVGERGAVRYISDKLGVHKVENNGPVDGVTLHLYAPPIRRTRVYDNPEQREAPRERIPGYYSKYGQRVPGRE